MAIEIDPVCGMRSTPRPASSRSSTTGTTYWFCGKGCLLEFSDDPDKYLAPDHEPSMLRDRA